MIDAEKRYKKFKYDKEVISYMENLVEALNKQYGSVDDSWSVSLDLIAFNYDIIVKCRKDIEKNGFEKTDDRGRLAKNPCISICNQAQGHLMKLLSAFGLNIMSKSKLKDVDSASDTLDDLIQ